MKRNKFKIMVASLAIMVAAGVFAGCGNKNTDSSSQNSGNVLALGSTALQPLAEESSKNFQKKYPDATIIVQGGGSGAGVNQVTAGTCQIGNSDVKPEEKLKDKNLLKQLVDHKVCAVGFAIVVNKDTKVDSLTKEQIQEIFTGKVTNWKEFGGDDEKINIINRPKSSGTRSAFKNAVMDGKSEKEGLGTTQDSSGAVHKAVKNTKGSISYLALSYLKGEKKEELKILKINQVEANKENITSQKYPFWSYEYMITKGEAKGLTKQFIDYMISDENKSVVEKLGYIPISDMKE